MEVGRAVSASLIALASAALLLTESAHLALALSAALLCLALLASAGTSARLLRALLPFSLAYLLTSLPVQLIVLGSVDLSRTALLSLKLTSVALGSTCLAALVYPLLVRGACRSWALLSLLVAMRSVAESYLALSDVLDAARVNYGSRGRLSLSGLRAVAESVPALVLDVVLRRFEAVITMLPGSGCRASRGRP